MRSHMVHKHTPVFLKPQLGFRLHGLSGRLDL